MLFRSVVDEAAGVHTADTGTIPAFVSRVSRPGSLSEPSTVQTPITIAVDHLVEYEKDAPAVAVAVSAPARAPGYLGAYAFASLPATANEDDTALAYSATSSKRGIYAMIAGTWTKLAAPSVDVLSRAWPDISRATLAEASGGFAGGPYGTAADYYGSGVAIFDVLAAQTAFINKLFAQVIVLATGGSIQSDNYDAGEAGFAINADGSAEFNDVVVRGSFVGETYYARRTNQDGTTTFDVSIGWGANNSVILVEAYETNGTSTAYKSAIFRSNFGFTGKPLVYINNLLNIVGASFGKRVAQDDAFAYKEALTYTRVLGSTSKVVVHASLWE